MRPEWIVFDHTLLHHVHDVHDEAYGSLRIGQRSTWRFRSLIETLALHMSTNSR
jgi:hypothetical protein